MKKVHKEKELLRQVIEIFQEATGVATELLPGAPRAVDHQDATIRINFREQAHDFVPEVKNVLTRTTVGATIQHFRKETRKPLLITKYVTPPMADLLKGMDIPFMDAAGNAYINDTPLYIFIKGNKPAEKDRPEPLTRAFQPAGLMVGFALLCNPGMENAPYRQLATAAGVALGTVGWVINDLKRMGFLLDMGIRGRRLLRREQLLTQWVTAYPLQLRPKQVIGRFIADDDNWWEQAEIGVFNALWGGEVAAAKLTKYLKPQIVTVYARELPARLILKYKLKKEYNGNVEILKPFWNFEYHWAHRTLVPPMLIYADLLATGDPRNIETARIIYDKEIARHIRED